MASVTVQVCPVAPAQLQKMSERDLVTGAFGYTGSRIAERLLAAGREVATLTRRDPGGHPLAPRVKRLPYDFGYEALAAALAGVDTVYVTYWMRFPRGTETWDEIVDHVARLATASAKRGVRRLVYVSVSNAAHDASTAYFRAKVRAEDAVRASGLSYAIVRPTLLYGPGDILINNMAWTLRRLPAFGIVGDGRYRVQPVLVDDVADLGISLGGSDEVCEVDAAAPETLEFNEVVRIVRAVVRSKARLIHLPAAAVLAATRVIGMAVNDVVLTRDEIRELTESLLVSHDEPTTPTLFSEWVAANARLMGRRWSSELERNFRFARGRETGSSGHP
jgi:nucleoside-diphosphate-sugar epimerase